jgi:hypothetical protein
MKPAWNTTTCTPINNTLTKGGKGTYLASAVTQSGLLIEKESETFYHISNRVWNGLVRVARRYVGQQHCQTNVWSITPTADVFNHLKATC